MMKNSKLDLIQSISEQQQKADRLQASLQQLSETLISFEELIRQSGQPITGSTSLLYQVKDTAEALEWHLRSILGEVENLSPQRLKALTAAYMEQIEALQRQLAHIDIAAIQSVKNCIDSFSVSMQELQARINSQLQRISIDSQRLQNLIQAQVEQAIEQQSSQIGNSIQALIGRERIRLAFLGLSAWSLLSIAIIFFMAYQAKTNPGTLLAQQEQIRQNMQEIRRQEAYLNSIGR